MTLYISPYVTSGPVSGQQFYNRDELIAEITSGMQRAFYVLGTRQIGKTSLLHEIDKRVLAILLNIQEAGGRLENLARLARWEVEEKRKHYEWLPSDAALDGADLFAVLRAVNHAAQDANQLVWILVDETEGLLEIARVDPSVLHRLRGTIQSRDNLRAVLVAAKSLSETNRITLAAGMSAFLSGFAPCYLGGFSPTSAEILVRQLKLAEPVQVAPELVARLFELTNGHPLFLQLLGKRLFEDGRLRWPTEGDLLGVGDQADKAGMFDQNFVVLSEIERVAVRRASEAGRVPTEAMTKLVPLVVLDGLTALGFLRRTENWYAIGNEFLARWLREVQPWDRPSTVSDTSALTVYEQTQLEPVLAAVRQNQIALAEMERILNAIRRVLSAWQREGLPEPDAQTRTTLAKIKAAVTTKGGPQHKLEATLPLLPLLPPSLVYKVEWGGEIRDSLDFLQKQLDELKRKLGASA
jgi:hypothetical protein